MDNASIHQSPRVKELIEGCETMLIYCAPYSPDFNPIETAFHQYKAFLKRRLRNSDSFVTVHLGALRSITKSDMCGYYRDVGCISNVDSPEVVEDVEEEEMALFFGVTAIALLW
jgi:hypothetical protein